MARKVWLPGGLVFLSFNVLAALNRLPEAVASYQQALRLNPDLVIAHSNLASALLRQNKLEEAVIEYRRAISIDPGFSNLGTTLVRQGKLAEGIDNLQRALQLNPNFADAHSSLIFARDLIDAYSVEDQQLERRRWYERHGKRVAGTSETFRNRPDPERRLRVGYVSADFRKHSAAYIFGPILRNHDHAAVEVFCYSGVTAEDEVTQNLRRAASMWRSTVGLSDEALAQQIYSDEIDILVDLPDAYDRAEFPQRLYCMSGAGPGANTFQKSVLRAPMFSLANPNRAAIDSNSPATHMF